MAEPGPWWLARGLRSGVPWGARGFGVYRRSGREGGVSLGRFMGSLP